jgi:hypothetical protein
VESKLGPFGTSATRWPIVPALGDCEDGEFGGMNGRGYRVTRRKPAPTPLCPPQILLDQTRDWTRAAAVGSQRLTASAMERSASHYTASVRDHRQDILTATQHDLESWGSWATSTEYGISWPSGTMPGVSLDSVFSNPLALPLVQGPGSAPSRSSHCFDIQFEIIFCLYNSPHI